MKENIFSIDHFNIIQDEENYYFFRALNRGDNKDIDERIVTNNNGEINRIRTDRERWEEDPEKKAPRYTQNEQITLEEVNDHIKMHQRKDTNCISLSSNANVSIVYGRGYYADKYVMVKVPKKEMGQKVVNAGQYMLEEIEKRINEAIATIDDPEILDALNQIDNATTEEEIKNIIEIKYQLKETYKRPTKRREKIALATPHAITSSYQALSEEQSLEKNKIIGKLTLLERKGLMEPLIPNTSKNTNLIRTVGSAFSSLELIHYGDIEKEEMVEVPKEIMDILALLQQATESKEIVQEIEKEVIGFIMSGKTIEIPTTLLSDAQNKKDISIEEMYEITGGKVSYGKIDSAVKKMFYLSKSKLRVKELVTLLIQIIGDNSRYQEVIAKIEEIGFSIEPEIITRQNKKGYKLSESVNLDLSKEEYGLVEEYRNLTQEELFEIYENGGLADTKGIIGRIFEEEKRTSITKERYYAEAIIDSFNWESIGIGEFTVTQRNELISKLENNYARQIYRTLEEMQIEKQEMIPLLFGVVSIMEQQRKKGNIKVSEEKLIKFILENKELLNKNITVEQLETLLGYYDVKGSKITLKGYQKIAADNVDEILDEKNFASLILPTGAGKTFVVLAELLKYKNEKILYIAPSYEILEQVKKYIIEYVHGTKGTLGKEPDQIVKEVFPNIEFATYSSLIGVKGKEKLEEQYDFIVLDELHRTGAKEWGKQLDKLLENQGENVKVLGITATPERDRENRNMADEIALKMGYTEKEIEEDKHIAMNMSLVDAIRLGIVVNPKVVSCEYTLLNDGSMEKLLEKINNIDDEKLKQEKLEKYEKLRRNLDAAKGIEEILKEHVEEGKKYIVFIPVAGKEEGKEAEEKIKETERKLKEIFPNAGIYSMLSAYGEKRNTKELDGFESSQTSETKFMIVMNKLNEGVHVKGVKGIIWERALDEESTILCMQQLGRVEYALDRNKKQKDEERPVVIDIANNLLKVRLNEKINTYTSRDDLILLRDIVDWVKAHNDYIPDINSTNREEERYAASLIRIQKKYEVYLEGIDEEIEDKERKRIEKILSTGKEIDLWNIELSEREKKQEKDDYINDFEITGILHDYCELEDEVDIINVKKSLEEVLVDVLEILQAQGVDLTKLHTEVRDIGELIKIMNEKKKIIKEMDIENALSRQLSVFGFKIDLTWLIGSKLANARNKGKQRLKEELVARQYDGVPVFSEKVIKYLVGKEKSRLEIFVDVLEILQKQGVDLTKLHTGVRDISELIKYTNEEKRAPIQEEEVEEALQYCMTVYGSSIKLGWLIGNHLAKLRMNKKQLREELERRNDEAKDVFSEDEIKKIVGVEVKKGKVETFVDVLEILQNQGVDLKKLNTQTTSIRDLINATENKNINEQDIEKALSNIVMANGANVGLDNYRLGSILGKIRSTCKQNLKKELERRNDEGKEVFEQPIINKILGAEKRVVEIFVDVLEILQVQGVDLLLLQEDMKIIDIIRATNEGKNENKILEEDVKKELEQIVPARSENVGLDWRIGSQIHNIKGKYGVELKHELENRRRGNKKIFGEEIIKRLLGEKNSIEIFVDVLQRLAEKGIDFRYLYVNTNSIKELIEICNKNGMQIDENAVEEALKDMRTVDRKSIDLTWKIGNQLKNARGSKKKVRKEMECRKKGEEYVFSEELVNRIVGKIKDQKIGEAGVSASVVACDEVERTIKEMMQERQMIY